MWIITSKLIIFESSFQCRQLFINSSSWEKSYDCFSKALSQVHVGVLVTEQWLSRRPKNRNGQLWQHATLPIAEYQQHALKPIFFFIFVKALWSTDPQITLKLLCKLKVFPDIKKFLSFSLFQRFKNVRKGFLYPKLLIKDFTKEFFCLRYAILQQ